MAKFTHITDSDRLQIELGLRHGTSIKKIAALIGKHHSTVAREVLARRIESLKGAARRLANKSASGSVPVPGSPRPGASAIWQ